MRILAAICIMMVSTAGVRAQKAAEVYAALVSPESTRAESGFRWYNLTYLRINGDSLRMEQMPLSIDGTDTIYSSAVEDMLAYKGKLQSSGDTTTAVLTLIDCDTCAFELLDFAPAASMITDDFAPPALSAEDSLARVNKLNSLRRKELRIVRGNSRSEIKVDGTLFRRIN